MKKASIVYLIISFCISLALIGIYQMDNFRIRKIDMNSVSVLNKDDCIMNIDSVIQGEKYIEIDGWAIEKGVTHEYFNWVCGKGEGVYNNNKVVLEDEEGNLYEINTVSQDRRDVKAEIGDDIDYARCGFKGLVKCSKLKKDVSYNIGVVMTTLENEKILIISDKEIVL